jgi:hypothetical protein
MVYFFFVISSQAAKLSLTWKQKQLTFGHCTLKMAKLVVRYYQKFMASRWLNLIAFIVCSVTLTYPFDTLLKIHLSHFQIYTKPSSFPLHLFYPDT